MTYQLVIWCRCGVDINKQPYYLKFELRLKVNLLVDVALLWQPIQNIRSMITCGMLPHTFVTSITSMCCVTFNLEMFQYLANQRRYFTMATKCVAMVT